MNWLILIPVGVVLVALLIFLIRRNQKDETLFEKELNNDYPKPKEDKADVESEELTK